MVAKKAPARFELAISCLLDRRFNQLSHGAGVRTEALIIFTNSPSASLFVAVTSHACFTGLLLCLLSEHFRSASRTCQVGRVV